MTTMMGSNSSASRAGGAPAWSSNSYDQLGRTLTQSQPDPDASSGTAITTFSYDGLTSRVINATGQSKTTTKNAQGQVSLVLDAVGNTISYRYDALGQLIQTDAAGSITTLEYNQRGQKKAMQDPVMGSWIYHYNVFGELVYQRDSLGQSSTMAYDQLGRMTQRTEPDLLSEWKYDTKFDDTACGWSVGKLCEARSNNGYNRQHSYDGKGRLSSTATVLDNAAAAAVVSESFDVNTGRVLTKTWPSGYQASYGYSPLGYLTSVTGGGSNGFSETVSYQVLAMNPQGQITQYRYGNQITTVKDINPINQRLKGQTATLEGQGSGNVLNQSYSYDALGNLMRRIDSSPGVGTQEIFDYDRLNRLISTQILGGSVSPPTLTQVQYDARGNISYKSDVGRYWYDAARPNRMTNITLASAPDSQPLSGTRVLSYAFDDLKAGAQTVNGVQVGNGNLWYTVSQDSVNGKHNVRWEDYTSFNMPAQIRFGSLLDSNNPTNTVADRTLSFVYGPEHQRIKQNVTLTGNGTSSYFAGNTWYLNGEDSLGLSYEKEVRANGTVQEKHYVSAGGVTFALFTRSSGQLNGLPATSTSYFHHDQLGSISAITNEAGVVQERLAYDPWGKRRFINSTPGLPDQLDAIVGVNTERGFTMHEHLDEIGVIHMNGRIYDPLIGRFMSADPHVTHPYNLQSFNRYAYVMNNPLRLVDPTGFDDNDSDDCNDSDDGATETDVAPSDPVQKSLSQGTLREVIVTATRDPDPLDYLSAGHDNTVTVMVPTPILTPIAPLPVPLIRPVPVTVPVPSFQNLWNTILSFGNVIQSGITQNGFWGMVNMASREVAARNSLSVNAADNVGSNQEGLGTTRPDDAPAGTLGLDQAGKKYGWDKDTTHGIKDEASGGMSNGKTWIGVAPDGTVGINENGNWSPQTSVDLNSRKK